MRLRKTHDHDGPDAHTAGPSLARGPALIIGSILVTAGLIGLITNSDMPPTSGFPDAEVTGEEIVGIEVNGWTNWLAIAAGALLMFGAAQHLLAKTMSLIVGLVLGAAAVIGAIDGDILGLAASNWATWLVFGVTAALLLINALMPRVSRKRERDHDIVHGERDVAPAPAPAPDRVRDERDVAPPPEPEAPASQREGITTRSGRFERAPATEGEREVVHAGDARVEAGDPLERRGRRGGESLFGRARHWTRRH